MKKKVSCLLIAVIIAGSTSHVVFGDPLIPPWKPTMLPLETTDSVIQTQQFEQFSTIDE